MIEHCPSDRQRRSWQHEGVRFHAEHTFHGSVDVLITLLTDAKFYVDLALPDLSQPEVVEERRDADEVVLRLRYEFVGSLDPIVQRLLGSSRLYWMQQIRMNEPARKGVLLFEAEKDPKRLHGAADFALSFSEDRVVRRIDGDLTVAIPGIGRMAERRIVPGLLHRLDIEAQALEDRLQLER